MLENPIARGRVFSEDSADVPYLTAQIINGETLTNTIIGASIENVTMRKKMYPLKVTMGRTRILSPTVRDGGIPASFFSCQYSYSSRRVCSCNWPWYAR